MNVDVTIIYWRDIPAQVVAKAGRQRAKRELSPRFQVAIDRAAMEAGLVGTDEYLTAWRREATSIETDDIDAAATSVAADLEQQFSPERLRHLASAGGESKEQP